MRTFTCRSSFLIGLYLLKCVTEQTLLTRFYYMFITCLRTYSLHTCIRLDEIAEQMSLEYLYESYISLTSRLSFVLCVNYTASKVRQSALFSWTCPRKKWYIINSCAQFLTRSICWQNIESPGREKPITKLQFSCAVTSAIDLAYMFVTKRTKTTLTLQFCIDKTLLP